MSTDSPTTWPDRTKAALGHGAGVAVLAVFCYQTASWLPFMHEAYWAPIAAVVVLYPDLKGTRQASLARFLGTALGSLIGWGAATWWRHDLWLYGLAILVAVAVCYMLRLENAARLCAVAVTVITLIPHQASAGEVAFHRFAEVSYGVACALVYTLLLDWVRRRLQSRAPA